jgi:hypothetical protein
MATRHTTNHSYRIEENERNAELMATRRTTNQAYRIDKIKGMPNRWRQDVLLIMHTE